MAFLLRIKAVLFKEFIQMRRDRITFAMMVMVPILQILLFGYSINSDPRGLPMGVVLEEKNMFTRRLITSLENSTYFQVQKIFYHNDAAKEAIKNGEISFLLTVKPGVEQKIIRRLKPQILFDVDASDPGTVGGALAAIPTLVQQATKDYVNDGAINLPLVDVVVHRHYNPEGKASINIVPGLIAVILSMTMIMMTSMALAREAERGTMENMLSMPLTPFTIMIGKITPYILVGFVQFLMIVGLGKVLFDVPFKGNVTLAIFTLLLFITSNLLIGYLISTIVHTQLQAMQVTFFYFMPSLLISGFMFPFYGMPKLAQVISEVFPITHFLRIIRGIMLKGSALPNIYYDLNAIVVFSFIIGFIAVKRFRQTLD